MSTTAPALSTNLRAFSRTGAEARPRENQACLRVQFRAKLRGDATDNKCGACGRLTVFIVGAVYNQLGAALNIFEFGWFVTPPPTKSTRCEQGAASAVGLRSIQIPEQVTIPQMGGLTWRLFDQNLDHNIESDDPP